MNPAICRAMLHKGYGCRREQGRREALKIESFFALRVHVRHILPKLLSAASLLLASGCGALPEFSAQPSAINGQLSFDDLIEHIECEIAGATRAGAFRGNAYAVSVSLSAEVTSTSGLAPSLSYVSPLSGLSERTAALNGQYSRSNHKNLTKNLSFFVTRDKADAVTAACSERKGAGIGGDLDLNEAIALGSNERSLFQQESDPKVQNNFVITVDFTITRGASGGPNWNLVHFKGPDSAAGLVNWTNVAKDTLILSFARVELPVQEEKRSDNMREAAKAAEDGLTRSLLERIVPNR